MKKIFKGLSLGFLALALVLSFGVGSASAATTFAVNAITETGALTVTAGGALGFVTGTGAINLGADAAAKTITVGNVTGATAVNVNTGTGGSTWTTTNGAFGLVTGTGAINLGADAAAKTITIGNATGATALVLTSGTGDIVVTSADDISLNSSVTGNVINVGTAAGIGSVINLGTSDTANTINIGTGAVANLLTIGSTTGAAAVNILAGTGGIDLTGHVVSKGDQPSITQSAGTAPTVMATNTDTAGWFRSSAEAHTTVTVTFAQAYAVAPHCTFSPDNAAAAILQLTSPGVYGTTTTTALTLTHASDATAAAWNYICVGAE